MTKTTSRRLCGGIGLAVAAFALVAGIVAAPLVQWAWAPKVVVTERGGAETDAVPTPATVDPKPGQG